jgi:ubiquitin conjugation factor E4 B
VCRLKDKTVALICIPNRLSLFSPHQVMQWIIDALLVNTNATAMRPDPSKVSSTATLMNLSVVLLKLCEPFMSDEKKAGLIDPGFVSSEKDHKGVYVMTGDDAVPRLGENPRPPSYPYDPKNSFIPMCFYLAARSLSFGIVPLSTYQYNLLRQISHTHWELRNRNADIQSDPNFSRLLAVQRANEITLYAEEMVADTLRFCNLMAGTVLKMDDAQLCLMPEFFVDDICSILQHMAKMKPKLLKGADLRNVFQMVVKLLSPTYAHVRVVCCCFLQLRFIVCN